MADSPEKFARVFKAANTVVRPLLGSRLHPLLSGRLMLLEYTGAKTGRRHTFPVGYFTWDGGDVLAFSTGRWPAHLRSAPSVRLLIRGRWHHAVPTVISDQNEKAGVLAEFARRNGPRAARGLMLGLPGDRQPDREELLAAAVKTTVTRFALTGPDDISPDDT